MAELLSHTQLRYNSNGFLVKAHLIWCVRKHPSTMQAEVKSQFLAETHRL